jgi:hypothetical protein
VVSTQTELIFDDIRPGPTGAGPAGGYTAHRDER